MASRTYFLSKSDSSIQLNVEPFTIGIASTVVNFKKSGGTVVELGNSAQDPTGIIADIDVGISSDLLNGVLVITTAINLVGVADNLHDSAFENLRIDYHLNGGVDGEQHFNIDSDDKLRILDNTVIIGTKAIKFQTHEDE